MPESQDRIGKPLPRCKMVDDLAGYPRAHPDLKKKEYVGFQNFILRIAGQKAAHPVMVIDMGNVSQQKISSRNKRKSYGMSVAFLFFHAHHSNMVYRTKL